MSQMGHLMSAMGNKRVDNRLLVLFAAQSSLVIILQPRDKLS